MNKDIYFITKQTLKNNYLAESSLDDISKMFALSDRKLIVGKEKLTIRKISSTNNYFIVLSHIDAIICSIYSIVVFKRPKIILRLRGTIPEESFSRHKSKFRWIALYLIEFLALLVSSKVIVVSNNHRELVCKRYGSFISKKIFVLPNLVWRDKIIKKNTNQKDKQITFCYVGGISKWQNIDLVIYSMKYLVRKFLSAKFKCKIQIRTTSNNQSYFLNEFKELVSNYPSYVILDIKEVKPDKVSESIDAGAFGFIFRDDSIVNEISSPFKIRDYLAAGLKIIASGSIGVIEQFSFLIDKEFIYLVNYEDFKLNNNLYLDKITCWIEKERKKNFNYLLLKNEFVFEKLVNRFINFFCKP